jgi:cytochrome c oxidase subunit 3
MSGWWRDVVTESTVGREHTPVVKLSLRYGMLLFIIANGMFLATWIWASFHFSLFPGDTGIGSWPPKGVVTFDAWHLPLLNTVILLTSGTTVTWAHHALQHGDKKDALQGLLLTVLLGIGFIAIQAYSFGHAPFPFGFNGMALAAPAHVSLAAIYGSTFFLATGFISLHVIVGTVFLAVCLGRVLLGHFTATRHFGFEAATWYWRFVVVSWLFVFVSLYIFGQGAVTAG